MGNTYYWEPDVPYADNDGSDHAGNELRGTAAFEAMQNGWGNAPTLAADDVVLIKKGNVDLQHYVTLVLDSQQATWATGDAVKDDNGGGEWEGVIAYSDGADPTTLYVGLTNCNIGDITPANGINNTTRTQKAGIASADIRQLTPTVAGSAAAGNITFRGVNDTWTEFTAGADPMDFQVIFDGLVDGGATQATYCLLVSTGPDYVTFENCTFQNASSHNLYFVTNYADYWTLLRCRFASSGGGSGLYSNTMMRMATIRDCTFRSNAATGIYMPGTYSWLVHCVFADNGTYGIDSPYSGTAIVGCLCYDNGGDNLRVQSNNCVYGCIFDGSIAGSGVRIDATVAMIIACRMTNNNQYGIEQDTANGGSVEDYNVFHGNGVADLLNMVSGIHSYGDGANHIADPADDGYVVGSLNVAEDKELWNAGVLLNWDE